MPSIDPYRVLGISPGASRADIEAAYRRALADCAEGSQSNATGPSVGDSRAWMREAVESAYRELTQPADGAESARKPAGRLDPFREQLPLQNETTFFILVNVLDLLMTYLLLAVDGVEANPLAAYFLDRWGFPGMIAYKMLSVAVVCTISQVVARHNRRYARGILWIGIIVVSLVVLYSLRLLTGQFV